MYGVTWERCGAMIDGMDETAFDALLPVATRRLEALTARRVVGLRPDDWRYGLVGDALCAMLRVMHAQMRTGQGLGVKSVSNDGYAESYGSVSAAEADAEVCAAARASLCGTGLVRAL